jgi:hypothetical protein
MIELEEEESEMVDIPPFGPKTTKVVPQVGERGRELENLLLGTLREAQAGSAHSAITGGKLVAGWIKGDPQDVFKNDEQRSEKPSEKPEPVTPPKIARPGGLDERGGTY